MVVSVGIRLSYVALRESEKLVSYGTAISIALRLALVGKDIVRPLGDP
jgi:hypothetical protein